MEPLAIDGGSPVRRERVPFHALELGPEEREAASQVLASGNLVGNGPVSRAFARAVAEGAGVPYGFFTASATAAFHAGLLAAELPPESEVILPSFAFVSIANCLCLAGLKPVFVEIEEETFNLDLAALKRAVTPRTRAVVPIHYGGQSCDMRELTESARRLKLDIFEDAAQAVGARFAGKPLGSWGRFAVVSFHQTKNISTGEGGVLLTSDEALARRVEVVVEKGTNRAEFLAGKVDKYTWVGPGSSFVQSDLLAAVGLAQYRKLHSVTARRREIATAYREGLSGLAGVALPKVREGCEPTWHIFAIRVEPARRDWFLKALAAEGVEASSHFVPLHSAPYAQRAGWHLPDLPVTDRVAASLVRLPIHSRLSDGDASDVVAAVRKVASRL